MALSAGTRLGPYEITSPIGAGGMGEVYRARDSRLGRDVAIKILAPDAAADPERRERFDREAHAIAALNHPHICTLHDVGHQDGVDFLVMEYVEGETLAARLERGRIPIDQALKLSVEIADALDTAHRSGIVHRDLKPGNVMLTRAGVKLLDFGLAKLRLSVATGAPSDLSQTMTRRAPLTAPLTILGTMQYMAPEQIERQEADARSDIFAFGAVLYEMVTGRKAFDGKSQASVVAAILDQDPPPIAAAEPLAPPLLEHVVHTCLAKDPDERWQSAADVKRELQWISTSAAGTMDRAATARFSRRGLIAWAIAAFIISAAAAAILAAVAMRRPAERREITRAFISVAPAEILRSLPTDSARGGGRPSRTAMTFAPDGRSVAFSAVRGDVQQIFLRPLDQLEALPVLGTEGGSNPFFSPDAQWLAFWSNGALRKAPIAGGAPPTTIVETSAVFGAAWGRGDTIVYARDRGGLWQISAGGGSPRQFTTPDETKSEFSHRLPHFLPDGESVLFTITQHFLPNWDESRLAIATKDGKYTDLGVGADGRYVSSGHLVFIRSGTLMAAPFDVSTRRLTGSALTVVGDVMQAANMTAAEADTGAGQFSIADSGALLFVQGGVFPDRDNNVAVVDRQGRPTVLPMPPRPYFAPLPSPDGSRLVIWTQGLDRNVWTYDIARKTLTKLTTEGRNSRAIWTPDGKRITYAGSTPSGIDNLFWISADGAGAPERLTTSDQVQVPSSWSPDGRTLAFVQSTRPPGSGTGGDIWILSLEGDRRPRPLVQTRFDEGYPEFSPDGLWLAFVSNESGRDEVYVQPYPGPGPRRHISVDGGTAPAWSRDGRELFYTRPRGSAHAAIMSTAIASTPSFTAAVPHLLFELDAVNQALTRGYGVGADGKRFYVSQAAQSVLSPLRASQMILVQNWLEELKHRVPTK